MRIEDVDLLAYGNYERLVGGFEWDIPSRSNIAARVIEPWEHHKDRVAIFVHRDDGPTETWTYWHLVRLTKRYAAYLTELGVKRGDRVAMIMPQCAEVAALHLAIYAVGGVALPLSRLYGPDSIRYILADSGARVVVVHTDDLPKVTQVAADLPDLEHIVASQSGFGTDRSLADADDLPADFTPLDTSSEDPALLLYTSGSTGHPKGALHAHRIIDGYLLTFKLFFNVSFDASTVFYTPSDWAWVGGLLDILLPALVLGHPVVADAGRFSAERCFEIMERYGVTHSFLAPTAVKRLAQVPEPVSRFGLDLEVICSGGESVAGELLDWAERELGAVINEFYGLTEVNHLIGGCNALWPGRPGAMGRAYPGRTVAVLRDNGDPVEVGEVGEIAVRVGDPTQMLEYLNNPEATEARVRNGWIHTGDLAFVDHDGYYHFQGRDDDMIGSAGYRIGPAEVEEALLRHPAVAEVAVIPSPDRDRGQVVKALIVLAEGRPATLELATELQERVKSDLAAYKYPRLVEFCDDLPKTTTGKINRRLLASEEARRAGR